MFPQECQFAKEVTATLTDPPPTGPSKWSWQPAAFGKLEYSLLVLWCYEDTDAMVASVSASSSHNHDNSSIIWKVKLTFLI